MTIRFEKFTFHTSIFGNPAVVESNGPDEARMLKIRVDLFGQDGEFALELGRLITQTLEHAFVVNRHAGMDAPREQAATASIELGVPEPTVPGSTTARVDLGGVVSGRLDPTVQHTSTPPADPSPVAQPQQTAPEKPKRQRKKNDAPAAPEPARDLGAQLQQLTTQGQAAGVLGAPPVEPEVLPRMIPPTAPMPAPVSPPPTSAPGNGAPSIAGLFGAPVIGAPQLAGGGQQQNLFGVPFQVGGKYDGKPISSVLSIGGQCMLVFVDGSNVTLAPSGTGWVETNRIDKPSAPKSDAAPEHPLTTSIVAAGIADTDPRTVLTHLVHQGYGAEDILAWARTSPPIKAFAGIPDVAGRVQAGLVALGVQVAAVR